MSAQGACRSRSPAGCRLQCSPAHARGSPIRSPDRRASRPRPPGSALGRAPGVRWIPSRPRPVSIAVVPWWPLAPRSRPPLYGGWLLGRAQLSVAVADHGHPHHSADPRSSGADRNRSGNRRPLDGDRGGDRAAACDAGRAATGQGSAHRAEPARRGAAEDAAQEARRHHRRKGRAQHPQVGAPLRDRGLESLARLAGPQMGPQPPVAEQAAVPLRQGMASRLTLHLAPPTQLPQPHTGLVDGLTGGRLGGRDRGGDLRVAQAAQLPHHEGPSLALGQLIEVGDQVAQALPGLGLEVGARDNRIGELIGVRGPGALAQDRDRLVVGHPVEPRPQGNLTLVPGKGAKGARHRALKGVLGLVRVPENRATVAVELLVVALEDRLERPLVAPPREPDQPRIRQQPPRGPSLRGRRPRGPSRSPTSVVSIDR